MGFNNDYQRAKTTSGDDIFCPTGSTNPASEVAEEALTHTHSGVSSSEGRCGPYPQHLLGKTYKPITTPIIVLTMFVYRPLSIVALVGPRMHSFWNSSDTS